MYKLYISLHTRIIIKATNKHDGYSIICKHFMDRGLGVATQSIPTV